VEVVLPFLAVVGAYLVGSLSFAVIVSKGFGLSDPRTYGSKNPGATNVLRSGNKAAAATTLLLDAIKGWLPMWAVKTWGVAHGLGDVTLAAVGLAAFMGHLFPVFFKFKGGKGVATAAGMLFGVDVLMGLFTLATWVAVVAVSRFSSLGAIAAGVFAPAIYLFGSGELWVGSGPMTGAIVVMSAFLVWRHAENISRLLQGKESKVGAKKS